MQTKAMSNWAGLFSIIWMLGVFVLILFFFVPLLVYLMSHQIVIGPLWLWIYGSLIVVQLVPGLVLAIAGLKRGNLAGRICAILSVGLFLWFGVIWGFPIIVGVCSHFSK
jgi:hypothetical protein